MLTQQLVICETFYSVQGEGRTLGTPAVFLRLAGCNLQCNGFTYQDPKTGKHLGCDSKHVWQKGHRTDFSAILAHWETQGWITALTQGAHLVITGGEPLLQQAAVLQFIAYLDQTLPENSFIEIETNATIAFSDPLLQRLDQINASPKLAHSGETKATAYHADVLARLASLAKTQFKFVVANETDLDEIQEHYLKPFNIKPQQVCLMPEGGTREALQSKAPWVIELCKRYGFRYTPRLQVDVWDEVTGV